MARKKNKQGFDFSTDDPAAADNPFAALAGLGGNLPPAPDNLPEQEAEVEAGPDAETRRRMPLRVHLDRRQRRGKVATIITGYSGTDEALADLGKLLKTKCGVGGAVKDGEIIIQGNKRERVLELLREAGYAGVKPVGG